MWRKIGWRLLSDATFKPQLRALAKAYRDGLGQVERGELSRAAAKKFAKSIIAKRVVVTGRCVALFDPIRSEIDASLLKNLVLENGGNLCLPLTTHNAPLRFVAWTDDTPFVEAGFGTRAPASNDFVTPDILVMPLLAFDRAGNRLGYGQGHYDRTLAAMDKKPMLIGLAFHGQEAQHIDAEVHDVPLDLIITDQDVISVDEKGRF